MNMDGIIKFDMNGTPRLHVMEVSGHIGIRVFDSGDPRTINALTIWVQKEHETKVRAAVEAFNQILMET